MYNFAVIDGELINNCKFTILTILRHDLREFFSYLHDVAISG